MALRYTVTSFDLEHAVGTSLMIAGGVLAVCLLAPIVGMVGVTVARRVGVKVRARRARKAATR